jgi:Spy/CpxP family protein refolding chaperone
MFGFLVGTLCVIGAIKVTHRLHGHRHWHGHGRSGHGPWGHWGGRHVLFDELRLTPEQEKVVWQAWDELRDAGKAARGEWARSREDLGRAFGPEVFDAEAVGNAFARHDELLDGLRKALTGALARVHDVLDASQRRRFAEILAAAGPRSFGIYR